MHSNKELTENGPKATARIEAFSDGVFAIAITLLILELIQIIHVKEAEGLQALLLGHWESLLAFMLGFITILICWINHHLAFGYISKTDSHLMWVNGFVLLVVTFTPFPTAILAGYFERETNYALAFFGFNYFMMSVAAYSLCAYVYYKKLIADSSRGLFYRLTLLYGCAIVYTLIIFFICFVSVPVAIICYCLLFVVFAYPKEFAERLPARSSSSKA